MIEPLLGFKTHTLTLDNGREFCQHRQVSAVLGVEIFFAQPYHSWERGSSENVNSLVRRFFPKRTNFDEVSDEEIQVVEEQSMRDRENDWATNALQNTLMNSFERVAIVS